MEQLQEDGFNMPSIYITYKNEEKFDTLEEKWEDSQLRKGLKQRNSYDLFGNYVITTGLNTIEQWMKYYNKNKRKKLKTPKLSQKSIKKMETKKESEQIKGMRKLMKALAKEPFLTKNGERKINYRIKIEKTTQTKAKKKRVKRRTRRRTWSSLRYGSGFETMPMMSLETFRR